MSTPNSSPDLACLALEPGTPLLSGVVEELDRKVDEAIRHGAVPHCRRALSSGTFLDGLDTSAYTPPVALIAPSGRSRLRHAEPFGPVDTIVDLQAFKVGINRPRSQGDREEPFGGRGASCNGAFVGGELLVQAVTVGDPDERLCGNFPDYSRYPHT